MFETRRGLFFTCALLSMLALAGCMPFEDVNSYPYEGSDDLVETPDADAPEQDVDEDVSPDAPDTPDADTSPGDVSDDVPPDDAPDTPDADVPPDDVPDTTSCEDCPADATCCDGECVNIRDSLDHCGECGKSCFDGQVCKEGVCLELCGDTTCGEGEECCTINGVMGCANLRSDSRHCGACGDACAAGMVCCGGSCTDLFGDPNNCGICGVSCGDGQDCCGGSCTGVRFNIDHCGECGRECGLYTSHDQEPFCEEGFCGVSCHDDWADCEDSEPGCETDLLSPWACGACDNDCESLDNVEWATCAPGSAGGAAGAYCEYECLPGYADCDAAPGCETDLQDPSTCGVSCETAVDCGSKNCVPHTTIISSTDLLVGGSCDCLGDGTGSAPGYICDPTTGAPSCPVSGGGGAPASCAPGQVCCHESNGSASCADLSYNDSHCGGCGNECEVSEICIEGNCLFF